MGKALEIGRYTCVVRACWLTGATNFFPVIEGAFYGSPNAIPGRSVGEAIFR